MARPKKEPVGQLYVLKEKAPPHFIDGEIKTVNSKPFALPDGVKPGKHLEAVGK